MRPMATCTTVSGATGSIATSLGAALIGLMSRDLTFRGSGIVLVFGTIGGGKALDSCFGSNARAAVCDSECKLIVEGEKRVSRCALRGNAGVAGADSLDGKSLTFAVGASAVTRLCRTRFGG